MSSLKRPKDGKDDIQSGRRVPLQAEDTNTMIPPASDYEEGILNRDSNPTSRSCCGLKLPLSPGDSNVLIPKTNSSSATTAAVHRQQLGLYSSKVSDSGSNSPTPPPPPPLSPHSPEGARLSEPGETSSVSYTLEEFQQCYIYSFQIHDKVCREIELSNVENRLLITLRRPQHQPRSSASSLPIESTTAKCALEEKGDCTNLVAIDPCMGNYSSRSSSSSTVTPTGGLGPLPGMSSMTKQHREMATAAQSAPHGSQSAVQLPHDADLSSPSVLYSQGGGLVTVTLPKVVRVLEFRCD